VRRCTARLLARSPLTSALTRAAPRRRLATTRTVALCRASRRLAASARHRRSRRRWSTHPGARLTARVSRRAPHDAIEARDALAASVRHTPRRGAIRRITPCGEHIVRYPDTKPQRPDPGLYGYIVRSPDDVHYVPSRGALRSNDPSVGSLRILARAATRTADVIARHKQEAALRDRQGEVSSLFAWLRLRPPPHGRLVDLPRPPSELCATWAGQKEGDRQLIESHATPGNRGGMVLRRQGP